MGSDHTRDTKEASLQVVCYKILRILAAKSFPTEENCTRDLNNLILLTSQVAQRMAQEATRLLRKNYRDIPTNIEAVKEQENKAVGTGTGIW